MTDEIVIDAEGLTKQFKQGELDLVVIFGEGFADRIFHSRDAEIQLLSDGSEPN